MNNSKNWSNLLNQTDARLPFSTIAAYGCGDAACNIVYGMIGALLTLFYTDYAGVSVVSVGLVMVISRVFDGVSDVIMGFIINKTKSKWGKARPWVLWMALPYAITATALFAVPQSTESVKLWYIFITYNLCTTVTYTAINVAYGALSVRMTRLSEDRTLLSTWRFAFARTGNVMTVVLTLPLVKLLGNDRGAWIKAMGIWSIVAVILLLICFIKCEEKVNVEAMVNQRSASFKTEMKALLSNQYFWSSTILCTLLCTNQNMWATALTYYCKYIFGNDGWMYSVLYFTNMIGLIVTAVLCPQFLKKMGKRNLALTGAIIMVASRVVLMLAPLNYPFVVAMTFIAGVGEAPMWSVLFGMMGDAVEFGQWKSHVRQDNTFFAASSIGFKIGAGLAIAIFNGLVGAAGFISSTEGGAVQPESAIAMIKNIFLIAPVILWGLIVVTLLLYKLDKKYPVIMKELAEREARGEL